jgi:hypothetical protein
LIVSWQTHLYFPVSPIASFFLFAWQLMLWAFRVFRSWRLTVFHLSYATIVGYLLHHYVENGNSYLLGYAFSNFGVYCFIIGLITISLMNIGAALSKRFNCLPPNGATDTIRIRGSKYEPIVFFSSVFYLSVLVAFARNEQLAWRQTFRLHDLFRNGESVEPAEYIGFPFQNSQSMLISCMEAGDWDAFRYFVKMGFSMRETRGATYEGAPFDILLQSILLERPDFVRAVLDTKQFTSSDMQLYLDFARGRVKWISTTKPFDLKKDRFLEKIIQDLEAFQNSGVGSQ